MTRFAPAAILLSATLAACQPPADGNAINAAGSSS